MEEYSIDKALETLEETNTPQTIEFKVQNDFVEKLPEILSNCEQVKQWAIAQTEADRNLILKTDEDFDNGRKRCAEINKVVASIESRRKEVKKEYNKPYELFEKKLKEVTAVLTEAKDNLWSQITAAEEKVKAEKENDFKRYFENHDDYAKIKDYRGWEQIFDKTWLNKGKKYDTIFKEIDGKIKTVCDELVSISDLNSEFEPALLLKYKNGASLTEILSANRELKAQKEELERKKAEQQQAAVKQSIETPVIEQPQTQPKQAEVTDADEELITIDFRVVCTKTKLKTLGDYMKTNGIKYGRVPKGE